MNLTPFLLCGQLRAFGGDVALLADHADLSGIDRGAGLVDDLLPVLRGAGLAVVGRHADATAVGAALQAARRVAPVSSDPGL